MPDFTFHNILLPDGSQTRPENQLTSETGIFRAALRDLRMFTGHYSAGPVTVADLGCLEGGYAAGFAERGYDVTGFEANDENFECCELVSAALRWEHLRFVRGDVRETLRGRKFDAIFCCGLLYHMDRPAEFLRLMSEAATRLLILQTHFTPVPVDTNEGYGGWWYDEGTSRWSSWKNERAFWPAKAELIRMIGDAGFDMVFEQFDYRDMVTGQYTDAAGNIESRGRGMFVGIKPY